MLPKASDQSVERVLERRPVRGSLGRRTSCTRPKGSALAHWLVNGADGGRLFVRCFGGDGVTRENVAGDVLAPLTTMVWNTPSKSWTGGATMAVASLNRRMTVRLGDAVALAQIGMVGLGGDQGGGASRLRSRLVTPRTRSCSLARPAQCQER